MDDLYQRIRRDLDLARKARDRERLRVLSMTISELRNAEIDKRAELEHDEVEQVVARAIKKRREAAEQIRAAGRDDRADQEEHEAELLQDYLPPPLTEEAVRDLVRATIEGGASDMGAVMGRLMPAIRGRFDGKVASRIVREELDV